MANEDTPKQRWEIITNALSCLTAGLLYVILFIAYPLASPINYLVIIVGVLLLLVAPVLFIFTYREAYKSNAQKLLTIIRFPLFVASVLSIAYAMAKIIGLLNDMKLQLLAEIFMSYILLCLVLAIVAEVFAIRRR